MTSTGRFKLKRKGKTVCITGTVNHHWQDPYDWRGGLGVWIPGHGTVSDADAIRLKNAGRAKEFEMHSYWHQTMTGEVRIDNFLWFDSSDFKWHPAKKGSSATTPISPNIPVGRGDGDRRREAKPDPLKAPWIPPNAPGGVPY